MKYADYVAECRGLEEKIRRSWRWAEMWNRAAAEFARRTVRDLMCGDVESAGRAAQASARAESRADVARRRGRMHRAHYKDWRDETRGGKAVPVVYGRRIEIVSNDRLLDFAAVRVNTKAKRARRDRDMERAHQSGAVACEVCGRKIDSIKADSVTWIFDEDSGAFSYLGPRCAKAAKSAGIIGGAGQ